MALRPTSLPVQMLQQQNSLQHLLPYLYVLPIESHTRPLLAICSVAAGDLDGLTADLDSPYILAPTTRDQKQSTFLPPHGSTKGIILQGARLGLGCESHSLEY
ncbi:hypothetical protein FRB94_003316 [Tulasnella sp. JGI-2019a]|nr:hypothetical protein FRB93_014057 [Tulasnella sp. JGI-2019a]KAG9003204.1 hypothetical protein FRB94_003316 [Tulasnella sp. JGI-2019a]